MDALLHAPDTAVLAHLLEARRILSFPVEVSRLHWHPFGLYTLPLAKRSQEDGTWSRRLHLWHPAATPVGEASPYGVHTHSGTAKSHVLAGALQHHLYEFEEDPVGVWQRAALGVPEGRATLVGHIQAPTLAGMTHTLPANHPHGVTKPPGLAVSLFEQIGEEKSQPFTTWQRTDVPAEVLVREPPVPVQTVQREALAVLDQAVLALR